MPRKVCVLIWILELLILLPSVFAQDSVVVPDLTGLNVPQAAALLNRSGLLLGVETAEGWTEDSGLPQNTIRAQSVAVGSSVVRGTSVDVTVLQSPNALLIYDDNDITLVNRSDGVFDLTGITFNAVGGTQTFLPTRWSSTLDTRDCGQVWSIGATNAKSHPECESDTLWLTTNDPQQHFWTGAGGITSFTISQNGTVRATCPVVNPGRCEFFLAGGSAGGDVTDYVYFAYTPEALIILNRSTDKWMPLTQLTIQNRNTPNGAVLPLLIGDPLLFEGSLLIGDVRRLAPGQCLFFTNSSPVNAPPQPCDVIARLDIGANIIFWGQPFAMDSVTDGQSHTCPAATPGKLTLCIMPR